MSKRKIEKKLEQLQEILDKFEEVRVIDPNDPDTWDSDALYNLAENLKVVLKILEDQPIKGKYDERSPSRLQSKYDEFGQPLYEDGLCSLVDEYWEKQGGNEEEGF